MKTEEFLMVVFLSTAMFISTLGLGMLPQVLKIDEKYMRLISIYGGGLLVGSALIIIVPEGIKVLIGSYKKSSLDQEDFEASEFLAGDNDIDTEGLGHCIGISMASGFAFMLLFDELCSSKKKKTIN